jgi:curved DNA-binding protein CbpA
MELKGALETISIPELLQWLSDSDKTGTLQITIQSEKKEIYFKEGLIVSASSNVDKDRFGVVIVKEGYLTQDEILKLLEESKQRQILLGKLCVEKRIFTEVEASRLLQRQAEQIIESLFHRKEGEFIFKEGELPVKDFVSISIVMHQLFFDSASKRNDWIHIQSVLGHMDTILKPSISPPGSVILLSEFEQLLLSLCNGKNSIIDICAKVHKSDFEICTNLSKLTEKGWLTPEKIQKADNGEYENNLWQASILLEQRRYFKAVRHIEGLISNYPGRPALESLLTKAKSAMELDIKQTFLSDELCPITNPTYDSHQLQSLNLKPQDWFIYSRINGKTPLKDLYRISGQGRDPTQRTLYILLKSGAISIQKGSPGGPPMFSSQPVKAGDKKIKVEPESIKATKTGEYVIPDRFLEKSDTNNKDESTDAIPLDIKELDAAYSRFVKQNYYQILGVPSSSSSERIREAFVTLSRKYHPDMYYQKLQPNTQERLEDLFSTINHAYRILSNSTHRQRYDEELWANDRFRASDLAEINELHRTRISTQPPPMKLKPIKSVPPLSPPPKEEKTAPKPIDPPVKKLPETPSDQTEGMKELAKALNDNEMQKKTKWEELAAEGKKLYDEGKVKLAIEAFENAIKYNAKSPDLYFQLSKLYMRLEKKNCEKAEENIKKAIILQPENPTLFCHFARINIEKGDRTMAERYIKTALAWDPESTQARKISAEIKEHFKTSFFSLPFKKKKQ